jgi:hypothetical protein
MVEQMQPKAPSIFVGIDIAKKTLANPQTSG